MTCTLRNEGVLLTKRSPLHTQPPCHRRSIDRDCQVTGQCYARQRVNVSAPGSGQEEDFETMPFIRPRHRMQPKTEKKNVEYLVHRAIRGAKSAQDRVHDVFRRSMITTEQFAFCRCLTRCQRVPFYFQSVRPTTKVTHTTSMPMHYIQVVPTIPSHGQVECYNLLGATLC